MRRAHFKNDSAADAPPYSSQSRRPRRGFTIIELLVATFLFTSLIILVFGQISALARASDRASRGGAELAVAARFAEHFRNDARAAHAVEISPGGSRVVLKSKAGAVAYEVGAKGILERTNTSGAKEFGPRLYDASYALEETQGVASSCRLIRARWKCLAEEERVEEAPAGMEPAGRWLILDIMLRVANPLETKP